MYGAAVPPLPWPWSMFWSTTDPSFWLSSIPAYIMMFSSSYTMIPCSTHTMMHCPPHGFLSTTPPSAWRWPFLLQALVMPSATKMHYQLSAEKTTGVVPVDGDLWGYGPKMDVDKTDHEISVNCLCTNVSMTSPYGLPNWFYWPLVLVILICYCNPQLATA